MITRVQDTSSLKSNIAENVLNNDAPAVVEDGQCGFAGLPCKDFSDCLGKESQRLNGENVKLGCGKSGPPAHGCAACLGRSHQPFLFLENANNLVATSHLQQTKQNTEQHTASSHLFSATICAISDCLNIFLRAFLHACFAIHVFSRPHP